MAKYYTVEFRIPFQINEDVTPEEAGKLAQKECREEYGFAPTLWRAYAFEYETEGEPGIRKIWFFNPPGTKARDINANVGDKEIKDEPGVPRDAEPYYLEGSAEG